MTSTVFVTGGSGYVGRNAIRALVARGDEVRALARSDAAAVTVAGLGATPVCGDVFDAVALAEGMSGCGLVVHAAADVSTSAYSPGQERVNVEGTRTVLRAARAVGVPRAVHVSTQVVLADGRPIVRADESCPIPRRHAAPYAASKAAAERAALAENRDGLEVVVVRPCAAWGRDDTTLLAGLVAAVKGGDFAWVDNGRFLISTVHVANVVAGVLAAAERGEPGQVYYLSDGEPIECRAFITDMLAGQGIAVPRRSYPRVVSRAVAAVGDAVCRSSRGRWRGPLSMQEYLVVAFEVTVDDSRARRELGYRPVITREDGLAELQDGTWSRPVTR